MKIEIFDSISMCYVSMFLCPSSGPATPNFHPSLCPFGHGGLSICAKHFLGLVFVAAVAGAPDEPCHRSKVDFIQPQFEKFYVHFLNACSTKGRTCIKT